MWERDARVSSVMIAVRGQFSAVWLAPLGDDYRDDAKIPPPRLRHVRESPKGADQKDQHQFPAP